ncbi:MAG: mechanosensitive ion channel [Saprospiraceae bacterium]|nr:mechanosensitive ion channel [Saprospiraceae bacterium]
MYYLLQAGEAASTTSNSLSNFLTTAAGSVADWAPRLLGGLVALIIGLWLVRMFMSAIGKAFERSNMDPTLRPFLLTLIGFALKALLFITIAGVVGIPIASFAALIAAVGLAIGGALSGSLGNLASGVMLLIFRPFKVGDLIDVAGELGFVEEISVFVTKLKTFQNKTVFVPNGKITADKITNVSEKGFLRADFNFAIPYGGDIDKAKEVALGVLKNSPLVMDDPAPSVYTSDLTENGVQFIALPFVKEENYWDVFWGLRGEVATALGKAGFDAPVPQRVIKQA